MGRILIILGVLLVLAGLLWPWLKRLPLGRLPGDITLTVGGVTVYLPLATGLLVSVILTLILRFFR